MLELVKDKENFSRAGVAEVTVALTVDQHHHSHIPLVNEDGVSIDDQLATLINDFTLETAMSGIIFKHVDLKRQKTGLAFPVIFRVMITFFYLEILFLEQIPEPVY